MVGHKSKKHKEDGTKVETANAQDFISKIGSTRNKVETETKLAGKSEGAREFMEKVGRVSDKLQSRSTGRKLLHLAGAVAKSVEGASMSSFLSSLKLNKTIGRGETADVLAEAEDTGIQTYVFHDFNMKKVSGKDRMVGGDTQASSNLQFAIDIKVDTDTSKTHGKPDRVYLNFSIAPLKEDGKPDLKKEVVFDKVEYTVPGLKSADIGFDPLHDTGLVLAGVANGSRFNAQKLHMTFSLYEKSKNKMVVPLPISGNTDWSTLEGTVNVGTILLNSHTMEVVTAREKKRLDDSQDIWKP